MDMETELISVVGLWANGFYAFCPVLGFNPRGFLLSFVTRDCIKEASKYRASMQFKAEKALAVSFAKVVPGNLPQKDICCCSPAFNLLLWMTREMGLLRRAQAVVLLVLIGHLSIVASDCAFPAIFNFGDSTSDTGGIQAAFPSFSQAEFAPYGMTFPGKPFLRYSDGRLAIDFITEALGIPYLSPFFQAVSSNFSAGVNFATAGATSQAVTYISPFSLNVQFNQFREFKQRVLARPGNSLNALPSPDAFAKALYIVDIGGNDFSYGYTRNMTFNQVKGYIHKVVDGIIALVKGVYQEGGRTFLISDVGPQGCVPYFLTNFPNMPVTMDSAGCAKEFNEVTKYYNGLLRKATRLLRVGLSGSTVIFINTYDIKYSLTLNAAANGFQYATKACCGVGGNYNYNFGVQCGESKLVNGKMVTSTTCKDPSAHLNWDGVHYTEAANRLIARQILSGNFFDPRFPLDRLCQLRRI